MFTVRQPPSLSLKECININVCAQNNVNFYEGKLTATISGGSFLYSHNLSLQSEAMHANFLYTSGHLICTRKGENGLMSLLKMHLYLFSVWGGKW